MQHSLSCHSFACQFRFVVKDKSHTFFRYLYFYLQLRWRHNMLSEATLQSLFQLQFYSVINKSTDNGQLYVIC